MKDIFVREDALVGRLAPSSQNSKQHPLECCTELGVVALQGGPRHASVQESFYYLGPHHPRLQRQQACLREVVQFPLVALETGCSLAISVLCGVLFAAESVRTESCFSVLSHALLVSREKTQGAVQQTVRRASRFTMTRPRIICQGATYCISVRIVPVHDSIGSVSK